MEPERTLVLPAACRAAIEAHARAGYPAEVCGLLIGRRAGAGRREVVAARPARNLCAAPDRFLLDPADHLRAEEAAARRGLEVLGVYHSHPNGRPCPSRRDGEGAWSGWSYLIASIGAGGAAQLRSWGRRGDAWIHEGLLVDTGAPREAGSGPGVSRPPSRPPSTSTCA